MVEDGLYRSGQPSELSFPFLEKLRLKSIIWLAPEDPNPQLCVRAPTAASGDPGLTCSHSINFLADQDVKLHHLGVENAVQYDGAITEEVVLSSLSLLLVPASLPLLVMCNLGRHRTGTVIGVFRRLQRWNLTSILEEYRRCVGLVVRVGCVDVAEANGSSCRYAGPKVRVLNEQVRVMDRPRCAQLAERRPPPPLVHRVVCKLSTQSRNLRSH